MFSMRKIKVCVCGEVGGGGLACQEAEEALAACAVPYEEGVGPAPFLKFHVDALRAQPHLQVTQLRDWMAVPLLQPIGRLASAGRQQREGLETVKKIK